MGAAASANLPPFPDVAAALAAGKTQEEIDAWMAEQQAAAIKASPRAVEVTVGTTSTAGWIVVDGVEAPLAGAIATNFPPADRPPLGTPAPVFADEFGEFVKTCEDSSQLFNDVKKCGGCGKVCAVTLASCNGCGDSLAETPITKTNNVFLGFIHGVAKGPFPFRISTRAESDSMLVFDDPLAITRAHVCSIPTGTYVPDMRSLFAYPAAGLALMNKMDAAAWDAVTANYLDNEPFVTKALSPAALALSRDELRTHVIAGLNFPPSQFQIHLQYMLPPFTPFHAGMYKNGAHYTHMRFFPLEFVRAALTAMVEKGPSESPWDPEACDAESFVAHVRDVYGVDYNAIHSDLYAKYAVSHELFANYDTADFKYAVLPPDHPRASESRVVDAATLAPVADADLKAIENADKSALQSYGRPYDEGGKPSGVFYSHVKTAPLATLATAS
jgi:hypothetical protein